jgi:hypothetical protein
MENTFDLKKFLVENKLTSNSRILNESSIGGINLDTVKALAKEPAMQKVQDQLKANPELAKKAIKLLGDVLSGKVDNEIEEAVNPNLDYGVRRVKSTTRERIKAALTGAGLGALVGGFIGLGGMMAVGTAAAALGPMLVAALLGAGIAHSFSKDQLKFGAVDKQGKPLDDQGNPLPEGVDEETDDLADQVAQIVTMAKQM